MLAFTDIETTGLVATRSNLSYRSDTDEILEVACIVTDDKLVEVERFHAIVHPSRALWDMDEFVRDMHEKSGLMAELRAYSAPPFDVDRMFAAFLREHTVRVGTTPEGKTFVERAQLAGNTISFDRGFLAQQMPAAHAELHYRNVDVSSFNEVARRFWPEVWKNRPRLSESAAHRAMADAEDSLSVMRYYVEKLGPVVIDGTQPAAQ